MNIERSKIDKIFRIKLIKQMAESGYSRREIAEELELKISIVNEVLNGNYDLSYQDYQTFQKLSTQ